MELPYTKHFRDHFEYLEWIASVPSRLIVLIRERLVSVTYKRLPDGTLIILSVMQPVELKISTSELDSAINEAEAIEASL